MYAHYRFMLSAILLFGMALPLAGQVDLDRRIDLQDSTQVHLLETKRGDRFVGHLVEHVEDVYIFELNNGSRISFLTDEVESITLLREENSSNPIAHQWHEDLFITPTAFNYQKGQRYYRNTQLILNRFDFAASDNYSIGVGTFLPFSILVRSKLTTASSSLFNFGIGLDFIFSLNGKEDQKRFVQFFAVTTIGRPKRHFNFSAAAILDLRENIDSQYLLTAGGAFEVWENWSIIIDTILIPQSKDNSILPGAGLSWMNEKNRIDFGLFYFSDLIIEPVIVPGVAYGRSF